MGKKKPAAKKLTREEELKLFWDAVARSGVLKKFFIKGFWHGLFLSAVCLFIVMLTLSILKHIQ